MSGEHEERVERPLSRESSDSESIKELGDLSAQKEAKDLAWSQQRQQSKKFSDGTMGQFLRADQMAGGARFQLVDDSKAEKNKQFLHSMAEGLDHGMHMDAPLVRDLVDITLEDIKNGARIDKQMVADIAHIFSHAASRNLIWDQQVMYQFSQLLIGGMLATGGLDPAGLRDYTTGFRELVKHGPEMDAQLVQVFTAGFSEAIARGPKVDAKVVAEFSEAMTDAMIKDGQMDLQALQKFHDGLVAAAKHGLQIDTKALQQLQDGINRAAQTGSKMDRALLQKLNSAVREAASKSK